MFTSGDRLVFVDGLDEVSPPGELPLAGYMPLLVSQQWRNAALLNSTEFGGDAWAIYRDQRLPQRVGFRTWSNRYPSGAEPVPNSMPKANQATTWGDFLVLGDIVWKANPSNPLSSENSARYPHGLWFSEPGQFDTWDELEVQFVGQRSGGNRIVGMFPLEPGLVVASTSGMYLLRGTPARNQMEELRVGMGPGTAAAVAMWPMMGTVVWVDARGQVWQTDGERFARLDGPLPQYFTNGTDVGDHSVAAVDDYLVVTRSDGTFVLKSQGESGAWTELNGPHVGALARHRGSVYARGDDGLFRWGLQVPTRRGLRDGVPVESEVVTRPLASQDPHERAFWHRFGVAARGELVEAESHAGPWGVSELSESFAPSPGVTDGLQVFPAHGPSTDASFRFRFLGDVDLEAVTVWLHQGRPSR